MRHQVMKKILILISAFVVGCTPTRKTSTGAAQLPELGWTPKQVAKFMMEKYDYSVIDTEYGVEGGEVVYNFAPVSFYGIDGLQKL